MGAVKRKWNRKVESYVGYVPPFLFVIIEYPRIMHSIILCVNSHRKIITL